MLTRRLMLAAVGTLPLTRTAAGQAAGPAAGHAAHRLTILHMNDFHSRHEAVDTRALTCGPGAAGCYGGSARLAGALAAQRAAAEADGRAVLLLDAGDQFQGSLFFTAHQGLAELDVMHALGTEAMALGNHEFDRGPAVLARFIRAARFPVLAANIDVVADPDLAGLVKPYVVIERGGLAIGVIGLVTEETRLSSSPGPNVRFDPPGPALANAAAAARGAGAQLLIALSHLGVLQDVQLAGAVPGVAVFVGGHSHTLLSNQEPGRLGPYPVLPDLVRATPDGRTLVVQAAAYGRYIGRLDLDVAAGGTVLAWGGDTQHVGLDGPQDAAVAAIVARYAAPLDAVRHRVVATLPDDLDALACRVGECALGNTVADALRRAGRAEIGLMNGGGLRTGLRAGPVTLGQVLDALPFGNALATLVLSGADVQETVRHGLSLLGRGGFPQVSGLRIVWDPTRPAEDRLVSIAVQDADGGWAPLDPARRYRVATNDFLRRGGDGYSVLRDRAVDPYDNGAVVADLAVDALGGGIASLDGRIARR